MAKIAINKDDHDRSILTDCLPYETPIVFNNEGLYKFKKSVGKIMHQGIVEDGLAVVMNLLSPKTKYTIPFEFRIRNRLNDKRSLQAIHPKSQFEVAEFYSKFDNQIVHQCSLSPVSLRFPSSVASHFYESGRGKPAVVHKGNEIEIESSAFEGQPMYATTYFSYRKFNFLYKFLDSDEFLRLEKKFHCLMTFDISKCFPSIYTHSISWAVKDKEFSKEHKDTYSFESEFDRLMQNSNYNETNGIVIGPEVSRIFAEIILQKVERKAIKKIQNLNGAVHNLDYSLRRYVDDYYLFTKETRLSETVFSIICDELLDFKLHVNEAKTQRLQVPFSTNLTQARSEVNEFLTTAFRSLYDQSSDELLASPRATSRRWINGLKIILRRSGATYFGVSTLIVSRLKDSMMEILALPVDSNKDLQRRVASVLDSMLSLAFFVYSMDTRVRTTYVISQAIVMTRRATKGFGDGLSDRVAKRIFDEALHVLRTPPTDLGSFSAEKQNLLIALSDLGEDYLIPQKTLAEICGFRWNSRTQSFEPTIIHDYFQIISLLFYMQDYKLFSSLRIAVEDSIVARISKQEKLAIHSEYVMLVLDSLSCPYLGAATKKKIAGFAVPAGGGGSSNKNGINGKLITTCESQDWFTTWRSFINIQNLLNKKELKTPYI